ncbi:DUF1707 SHOCT-like domain-containing protein [Saccharopolyspora montiporae]|uniref:DUF1707 SHOCT-like domain-containing protein n=1 Tax=Saccharopolyspora montiporae TaxID=2781240 RepID=UPI00351C9BC2
MGNGWRGKDLRIGDPERQAALRMLGEHMSVGRLDITEYEERSRSAAAARFRSELDGLFHDLPGPHPGDQSPQPQSAGRAPMGTASRIAVVLLAVAAGVALLITARQFGLLVIVLGLVLWLSWRR